jgi:uncharacterized membrane protein YphA (DoxX/SURF4 family)
MSDDASRSEAMVVEAMGMISLAVELFVGALLLAAGVVKIRAGESAVISAITGYEIGNDDQKRLAARVLPWLEVGFGVALILGFARDIAALGAGGLLAGFGVVMAHSLSDGRRHPCGCGGDRRSTFISWTLVTRNGVLVAALTSAELARTAPSAWSPANVALAALLLAGTLSSIALGLRPRVRKSAVSVVQTTSGT